MGKTGSDDRYAALEEALAAAEAANRAKSSFLSSMSHDIRTPMNAIVGMTSIALAHIDEKARVQDCLLKIKTASNHLMSLVNDVLDMSRIDSGRMTLNEEMFSLADLIHDIAVIVRPQAEQKKQSLHIEIGEIYEEYLIGDSLRLRQIIVNIIGNAVKYTLEDGKIHVRFRQRLQEDDTGTQPGNRKVILEFKCVDNGIGMSQEFLERIFIPFERVNNSTISKIEGTGLGMAIVKSLIDSMNGEITVESTEGAGSSFQVKLPLMSAGQSRKEAVLPVGKTVLMVEKKDAKVEQIAGYLQECGLKLERVKSGLEAVTRLTEAQYEEQMPCAMLLGQEIEDMPVLELASHIRQLAGRDLPILLVSEEDWVQIEYRAVRAGVNAFVPCPLFKSRLIETLAELLGGSQATDKEHACGEIDYSKYRALLVEDVELNQEVAVEMLSFIGIQVEVADNGAEAVAKFENSPEGWYDIIFMDIQMPVMNGYEASQRIRKMPRKDAKSVWIVAMTANAFVEDIRLSREAGMNEHCSKPIDPERLQEILQNHFQR
ncbi:MAG: response regulator [Roseburia sp.]|nr:response regulator [Roseburia sp.]MCM1241586.1 response regulator [Roseburia sp.]